MKILFISCGSGSDPTVGGSLERTREIAKRIPGSVVLTTSGGAWNFQNTKTIVIKTPIGYWQMDKWYILRQLWSYLLVFMVSPFIKLPEVDIVYLDSDGLWDIIPALWYKFKHQKVIVVSMNHHLSSNPINSIHQWISHKFIRRFDVAFCLRSSAGLDLATKLCHHHNRFVQNGIDLDLINSIPEQDIIYDVCFFGTPRPGKGLDEIKRYGEYGVQILIVGDVLPMYRKQLERPNIKIMGYIPDKREALKLVKQCKYFIAGKEEGWGIAIRECVACGLKDLNNPGKTYETITWDMVAKDEEKIYEDLLSMRPVEN
jgi:glycosyltransferase involved in cell wall biosynthesis